MKFEAKKQPVTFTPISITLETAEEVAAIYAVLNHRTTSTAIGFPGDVQDDLGRVNMEAGNARGSIPDGYLTYHRNLCEVVKSS